MQWSRWEMMGLDRGHGSAVERRCLLLGTARRRSCQFLVTDWLWEERRGYHQSCPGEETDAIRRQHWASSSSVSGSEQVFLLLVYVTRQNQHSSLSIRSPLKRGRMCLSGGSRYTLTPQHSPYHHHCPAALSPPAWPVLSALGHSLNDRSHSKIHCVL